MDGQRDVVACALDRHFDLRRRGVLGNVGQAFLQHAKHRGAVRIREVEIRLRRKDQLTRDSGAGGEVLHEPVGSRGQAQVVEHHRAQIRRYPARRRYGGVEQLLHRVELAGQRLARSGKDCVERSDVHFQRGQRLPQLVMQFASDAPLFLLACLARGQREALDFLLRLTQRFFAPDAGRDVAEDRSEELLVAFDVLRDGGFDRKFRTVGAHAVQHGLRAHSARGHRGGCEAFDMSLVRLVEALGNQHLERLADHRRPRPQEYALGRRVELHDALLLVDGDDRIHRRFDDAAHSRLDIFERAPKIVTRRLRAGTGWDSRIRIAVDLHQ